MRHHRTRIFPSFTPHGKPRHSVSVNRSVTGTPARKSERVRLLVCVFTTRWSECAYSTVDRGLSTEMRNKDGRTRRTVVCVPSASASY
ncbi:hypothetical protein ZHAS_00021939 [Anopheles sinensis]|uniref:Uncharacterized protein n=1 Tax=Anopheles sinensis TaxID=74873 RepID=A0A084WT92_ANOSI|nr:hypothetical protein ZHAS_00021939 [Anopheles sinensis]